MHVKPVRFSAAAAISAALAVQAAFCDDWPMYRKDASRSAITRETLDFPLATAWVYEPNQPPIPAWPEPGKELHRIDFDYCFHPVAAEGLVYFASSADDTLRALNAATGELVWQFTAGGPTRFAPAIANGRAYLASDDGWLYCLDAAKGTLVWRFHGAPGDDQLLGNGRMISRWPLRSGALVVDGVVYVAAGMWPTEGVYVYALDADTGEVIWCNDSSGNMYVNLPHPGASGFSGVAPQGYLAASGDILLVNTGRSIPAAFDRHTGKLLHYRPDYALKYGGTRTTIVGDLFFNPINSAFGQMDGGRDAHVGEADIVAVPGPKYVSDGTIAYSLSDGEQRIMLRNHYDVLVSRDTVYAVAMGKIEACPREAFFADGGIVPENVKWTASHPRVYGMACSGNALLVGGKNALTAFGVSDGKQVWQAATDGRVRGFAVADGKLAVATQEGTLLCFESARRSNGVAKRIREPRGPALVAERHQKEVASVLRRTEAAAGYALVVGESSTQLATALAQQTDLYVVALVEDEETLGEARAQLLRAGLYGSRVVAQRVSDYSKLPCASYFASLVVVSGDMQAGAIDELYRALRPCGGKLILVGISDPQRRDLLAHSDIPSAEISTDRQVVVRGPLPGAGEWRYELADGGRTGVGKEERLELPLELLWFGGPGPDRMLDRGARTSTPLSVDGRVFVTGQDHVIAFDAYTGRELWCREIEDVGRRSARHSSANIVADDGHLYVAVGHTCYQLDQLTGEITHQYDVPEELARDSEVKYKYVLYRSEEEPEEKTGHMEWGYVTVADGVLLGTYRFPRTHQWDVYPRYGSALFALDIRDWSLLWLHRPRQRIPDDHVVFGEGKVFLFDTTPTIEIERAIRLGKDPKPQQALAALDLRTGEEIWRTEDVPAEAYRRERYSHHLQYANGLLVLGASAVYEANTGKTVWKQRTSYARRALIYDDQIIAYPHSYDIRTRERRALRDALTGADADWRLIRAYGCGTIAGCRGLLFFRSGAFGFFDMKVNGLTTFGGARPGCSVTMVPANGLLIATAGVSGCACSYNYQTSFALVSSTKRSGAWYVFPRLVSSGKIKEMRINLGAPGGRVDTQGHIWQPYPRLGLGKRFEPSVASPVTVTMASPEWYHRPSAAKLMRNTTRPWLYTSGVRGQGTIGLEVELRTHVAAPPCEEAPRVDGLLDDECWRDAKPIPFAGNAHLETPKTTLLMRQDSDNLYFAYKREALRRRGEPVPFVADHTDHDDLRCREDDLFEIYLTDAEGRMAAHFGLSPAGARFEGKRSVSAESLSRLDLSWNGEWQGGVTRSPESWTAEIAIPKRLLAEIGAKNPQLMLNCMSQSLTHNGPKRIHLTDPELPFRHCRQSLAITAVASNPRRERPYTLRLHFAEPDDTEPGGRVFDILVQGEPVLTEFDIVREAGGKCTAVVRELNGIKASDTISVALVPKTEEAMAPLISGVEIIEERLVAVRPPPLRADEHTIALLHLDDADGAVARDASPNGHHATFEASPRQPVWYPHGRVGGCLQFDGRNADDGGDEQGDADGLILPEGAGPDPEGQGFTVEFWVRHADLEGWQFYFANNRSYYLLAKQDRIYVSLNPVGAKKWFELLSPPCLRRDFWHHVAVTHDGETVRLYCDGDEVARGEMVGPSAGGGAAVVGHDTDLRPSQIRGLCGLMDEIRISSIARTDFPEGPHEPEDPLPASRR